MLRYATQQHEGAAARIADVWVWNRVDEISIKLSENEQLSKISRILYLGMCVFAKIVSILTTYYVIRP